MADKRRIRRTIKDLQRVKTWQLIILLILAAFISASLLRLNNIGLVERRSAVLAADQAGDQQTITNRLYDLQRYVTAHMNTDMGKGIYLEASYNRDVQAAYTRASNGGGPNGNIYKQAQEICAPRFSSYSAAYLQCTLGELEKFPSATNLASAVSLPRADSYLHVYASPVWSPDFAGWSLVVCALIVLLIVGRLLTLVVLRLVLYRHYRAT